MLLTIDVRKSISLETVFSIAICCQFLSTFVDSINFFDCCLSSVVVIHLIQISEGFYYLDTVLGKFCGNTSLPPVISKTNIVYVWWKNKFRFGWNRVCSQV